MSKVTLDPKLMLGPILLLRHRSDIFVQMSKEILDLLSQL